MGKFTIAMKFTKRPSASLGALVWFGKVVLTRRRAWMLGPCQPAQRGIPNILRRRKGNNSQGTFVLLGEGNDSSEERLEQGGIR
jgi:hypothetical protein